MRVVSWNINSIRARQERVIDYLDHWKPDVLCLQETKVTDEEFPKDALVAAGYRSECHGQPSYNGVALCSRLTAEDVRRGLPGTDDTGERRVLAATFGGLRIITVYVPNGQAVDSEKYEFKLHWLSRLRDYVEEELATGLPLVMCGDFNVAPKDRDVHDPRLWEGKVLCSAPEREALGQLLGCGLVDLFREYHTGAGFYSWWDYRRLGFQKNRGLRIDLFLASPEARTRCTDVSIDREARKGVKPSDHAPVHAVFSS